MAADGQGGIAEGLEDRDLLALQGDEPADHDVEQEGRHAEENRREDRRRRLQLLEFLGQETVGELVLARIGARAAIGGEDAVDAVDYLLRVRAVLQGQGDVVERARHVVGGAERVAPHPEHAVALEVREHRAGRDLVHVFRRHGHAHHGERLALAVDDRGDLVARFEPVRFGESVGEHHLVAAVGFDMAATFHMDAVEPGRAAVRHRKQQAGDRVGKALYLELDAGAHAGFQAVDARHFAQALGHRFRCALENGEHFGEAVFGVEAVARGGERVVG